MKLKLRILAVMVCVSMLLGVVSASAEAWTVPEDLKKVEGLPENPVVPSMKTLNDGVTEVVTVSGELVSLHANWDNELFPLELKNGTATFDITGKKLQLGMEGKHTRLV